MTKHDLEDRIVRFASRCVNVCGALPAKKIGSSSFADQLFRSSTSVAANYAEAAEAESRKDFIHKLKIAMKELSETRVWIKIIGESSYVPASKLGALITECEKLSRILAASIITARSKHERV
ncbi:MAG: four helix bundle protein [Kiritimatiellae bacterium]|nr:four helix bundle protein [Kiritimatiellia bacterium]